MVKKTVNKLSDKLTKISDSFTVQMYDNGFVFEVSGQDSNENWKSAKIVCSDTDQLMNLIKEAIVMEKE